MPIRIDKKLPAVEILRTENIFVMDDQRAAHQDIRPLKILILNLMPQKMVTETQLLRHLANTPLQLDIDFLYMESHRSKTTRSEHMETFYKTFSEVKDEYFDGMIITGAPVEHLPLRKWTIGRNLARCLSGLRPMSIRFFISVGGLKLHSICDMEWKNIKWIASYRVSILRTT